MSQREHSQSPEMLAGRPSPLGASLVRSGDGNGVNFAIWSENASAVELCVFEDGRERRYRLPERTHGVWHGFLPGAGVGLLYGYRVHGQYAPGKGHRFNPNKLLIDPYARLLQGDVIHDRRLFDFHLAHQGIEADTRDNASCMPRCVVVDDQFDWRDDRPPRTSLVDTVIYELHVKGYTKLHPGVPAPMRGTYLGLAEPVITDHLQRLGVTAIELLPCASFMSEPGLVERGLSNYWGYNTFAFFAPHAGYAGENPVTEFQTMVRAMHQAGIEVIVDVVYNHTAESDAFGPTLSFRGIDNANYYHLEADNPRSYVNNSGCGNSLAVDRPAVLKLVLDSLRYWVEVLHVDGFRFDLAPSLARVKGEFDPAAAFFQALYQDPVLAQVKLIAEPWDVGHAGYQLGQFPDGWSEWNDRYRGVVRSFWRGDKGGVGKLASGLAGSSDVFGARGPTASVNFLTAHDGFSLDDLVSYSRRHNEINGEDNMDGDRHNHSWNHGVEGPTSDPQIRAQRASDKRALLATLFLSHGVPMLLGGDELGRTQQGNNNAYCQDNEISWVNWRNVDSSLVGFVTRLASLRRTHAVFRRDKHLAGAQDGTDSLPDVEWLHENGLPMQATQWDDKDRQILGVLLRADESNRTVSQEQAGSQDVLLLFNASKKPVDFVLPVPRGTWVCLLNTHPDPNDASRFGVDAAARFVVEARSLVVFSDQQ